MLVLHNNNKMQEENQKCQIFIILALVPFIGAASLRGPSLLQSATGTQFNVATVAGNWQLVLDLIDVGIDPGLLHKIRH